MSVVMDAGVYNWLREVIEAKVLLGPHYATIFPWYTDVMQRAVACFRTAGMEQADVIEESVQPPKKATRKRLRRS